jgi:hypothetical protein
VYALTVARNWRRDQYRAGEAQKRRFARETVAKVVAAEQERAAAARAVMLELAREQLHRLAPTAGIRPENAAYAAAVLCDGLAAPQAAAAAGIVGLSRAALDQRFKNNRCRLDRVVPAGSELGRLLAEHRCASKAAALKRRHASA